LHGQVYIAEISVLEIVSALGGEFRGRRISLKQYKLADERFIEDLAVGRIIVRPFPPSEYLPCRHLLAYVGIDAGRNLSSQDGIIAYTARQLAIEKKTLVRLLTADTKLANVIKDLDVFSQLVKAEYLRPS
jgi:hypothetical protein